MKKISKTSRSTDEFRRKRPMLPGPKKTISKKPKKNDDSIESVDGEEKNTQKRGKSNDNSKNTKKKKK